MKEDGQASERMRILVVDDNAAIHEDFVKILGPKPITNGELDELEAELFGCDPRRPSKTPIHSGPKFDIDSAFQGAQAIEMVRAAFDAGRPYCLSFVDGRMPPGLSGIETIPRLWEIDPRMQIVISSAYSDHTFADIVDALGHRDGLLVLRKPFDAIEVLQVTHALTRKWALARELENRILSLEETVRIRTRALEITNEELQRQVVERTRAQHDLKLLATHDPVTGIPNRVLLRERAQAALARARRKRETLALVLLDLDHFKDVNDTHGHPTGDELLKCVAARLRESVRSSDLVARLGGDEFAILLDGIETPEESGIIAERVLKAFAEPFVVAGEELHAPTSLGIAIFPNDCEDVEGLLKSADLALYEAKEAGRATYRFYAAGMLESSQEQLRMREDLTRAISQHELRVHYQPLVDLDTGSVGAMEALVRWQHPQFGMVSPLKFIPVAERTGQIVQIGRFVLDSACRQLAAWRADGNLELSMAVNVSGREVQAPDFVEFVVQTLAKYELPPARLELELTESTAMKDPELSAGVLRSLADLGVRLAIDDFGSGYSSLMRLKQMPISVLKIDRFFVRDLGNNPRDAAIISTVVAMAHSLDLTVVVEGVETQEQLEILRTLSFDETVRPTCDRVQGYLLSRPLAADAAGAFLVDARAREAFRLTGS